MKNLFLVLFLAGTMMSFANSNAETNAKSFEDFSCTVSGGGAVATADTCQLAYELWKSML